METVDWFKLKRYPHIGEPLTLKDYNWVKEYVENPEKIKEHSFLPLIHKCIVSRKYRANSSNTDRTKKGERMRIIGKPKVRNIYYASHLDAVVFSYYNHLINKSYEELVITKNFNKSIVAYRKIPVATDSPNNKCNIDFAKSTLEFIKNNKDKKLSVIVADVTSFFDNLNHKTLKKQWSTVLEEKTLPDDHYNVFKALTRLKYVEGDQLFNAYGKTMLVERGVPNSSTCKETKRIAIESNAYFKEKNAIAYCTKKEFLSNNLNLVISANNKKGIPQGSPISATLANIYMLDFDQEVYDKVLEVNGYYQRYSDDLIIICERDNEDEIIKFIRDRIKNIAKLEIHPSKTSVYRFEQIDGVFKGFEIDESTKEHNYNKTLEYLGFSFDGQRVLIKDAGFSKYHRSMKRSFKKSTSLALNSKNPDKSIFKSRLYKRFTHRGAKRRKIYHPSKTDPTKYVETRKYDWGNYLSYVYKANDAMISINKSDAIKYQSRRFWKRFHQLMIFHESKLKKK
ncbi:reverse transcriptase/maturase family protein [Leeuwenhoekiella aequorea]|uniref:Reverse transcriptase (RNA-dependent DNA polymerase) n=1 Tax=Leeuwenhoekiella aequorea TaxID=283736 RepID=A0A4Q0P634_9FLAO|nr:reverse transcriptase/maturase family protein [Leeuwenhoekiella aequorea]RXG21109.1 reverse transcriptase (RNA-dependent DNA polymerase) [Leeuwenhoekiella aequorea]